MEWYDKRVLSDIAPFHLFSLFRTSRQERLFDEVKIVLVGKYTDLKDSYMSVIKALEHSAFRVRRKLTIQVGFVCPE
jgi:CTP synthase (UTP-ammonia lyase)